MGLSHKGGLMEIKIIDRNVVPDRVVLYENDASLKSLVFTSKKINDGINLEALQGFLEVEKTLGGSDRYLLEKVVSDDRIYFSLPINLSLTNTADILSSQVVFENQDKSVSYRTKVFYIDVKYSVDGESGFEQVVPSVISQLEEGMAETLKECKAIKSEIEEIVNNFDDEEEENNSVVIDAELSLESENPVQNKVITQALDGKLDKIKESASSDRFLAIKRNSIEVSLGYVLTYPNGLNSGFLAKYMPETDGDTVGGSARLLTNTPTRNYHCATKEYVDKNKGTKIYKHTTIFNVLQNGTYHAKIHINYYSLDTSDTFTTSDNLVYIDEENLLTNPIITINGLINPKRMDLYADDFSNKLKYRIAINGYITLDYIAVDAQTKSHSWVAV